MESKNKSLYSFFLRSPGSVVRGETLVIEICQEAHINKLFSPQAIIKLNFNER